MYGIIKKFLFQFPPEKAHQIALNSLQTINRFGLSPLLFPRIPSHPLQCMGLSFPNPVGLSAGLDRNGDYIDALASLGFGFIEIGTVLPKAQDGNPIPRIFRLEKDEALFNRVGFASKGLDYVVQQLEKIKYKGILGINIGKNKDTPNEKAIDDYALCFDALSRYASYITINLSSPNTPGLRDLLAIDALIPLLQKLKEQQQKIVAREKKYIPLVIKISPDLSNEAVLALASVLLQEKIDGVIASNTTLDREHLTQQDLAQGSGGISGKPLQKRNLEVIKILFWVLHNRIPIIASGGIMDRDSARAAIDAGAVLLQIYTGFIYHGPSLIRKIAYATSP